MPTFNWNGACTMIYQKLNGVYGVAKHRPRRLMSRPETALLHRTSRATRLLLAPSVTKSYIVLEVCERVFFFKTSSAYVFLLNFCVIKNKKFEKSYFRQNSSSPGGKRVKIAKNTVFWRGFYCL